MMKVRKKLFTLSGLFMVLAQVFVAAFCGITAIAITKDETRKTLFDTMHGTATMAYEETAENRLKWSINLEKKGSELPTKFNVQLLGNTGIVTPDNLLVNNENDSAIYLSSGDGITTSSIYEEGASSNGKVLITFETENSLEELTVKPQLMTTEANIVDLLEQESETVFELPIVEESSDVLQDMVLETTSSIEEETSTPESVTAIVDSSSSSEEKPEQAVSAEKQLTQVQALQNGITPTLFNSEDNMLNIGDERDIFLYNGILTGNHSGIAADIEGAMFIWGNSVIPKVDGAHFFFAGHFANGSGSGGVGQPLTDRHRIALTIGGEFRNYSDGAGQVDGLSVDLTNEKATKHPGYLLTNETQAKSGWVSKVGSDEPYKNLRVYGPAKYLPDGDFESLKSDILTQQQKVYKALDSKIAAFDALQDKRVYQKFSKWQGFDDNIYYSADDPSVLIYKLNANTNGTVLLPGFNEASDEFITDEEIKQIIVYSEAEKIVTGDTDGVVSAAVAEKVVYYLPNATQITNYAKESSESDGYRVGKIQAPEMPAKFNDDATNQFNAEYFKGKHRISAAMSGSVLAPNATVAMTNANLNGYLWAKNLYQEGGWELHNFYNPWLEEQVNFRFQLHKYSSEDEKIAIEGATFNFYRMKGDVKEYLKANDTIGEPIWTTDKEDAKEFVTDAVGNINVDGIPEDGTFIYYFEEISPAVGYVMPENPHFEVAMDSVTKQPNLSEVPNTPIPYEKRTSLRVEKKWEYTENGETKNGIPADAPDTAKTVKFRLRRRLAVKTGEKENNYVDYLDKTYSLTYNPAEINVDGLQVLEWNSLPVYETVGGVEVGPYEYTAVELDNPYHEIIQNPDNPTKSAINSLTTVQNNSQTVWTYGDPSYIIIRDAQSWIVWTATHVPENEREEFALKVIEFGGEAGPPFNHFKDLYDANKKEFVAAFDNITWVEGNTTVSQKKGNETVYTDITVTAGETGAIDVTVDFRGETSSWTQFFYGGHSMREVAITNKYIKQNDIAVEKKWMLDNVNLDTNSFNTQEDVQLWLQRKIEGNQDFDENPVEKFSIPKGSSNTALSHAFTAPTRVKVGDAYKNVTYRVIEKVKDSSGNYTGDRVYGYATPTPEEPDSGDYIVTNTLLKTSLEFTKVGNDGESNLSGVTFSLTREGGGTWTNQTTGNDGKINFTGLPVGKYTLTEEATVAGYETAGPWYFEVVDSDGTLSLKWTDSTWVTEKASPIEDGKLVNKFKPFKFTVFKEDDLEHALPGATFTLTGPDGFNPQTLPNANDSSARSTFVFTGLTAPGEYTLTEDEAPNGYIGLSASIQLSISATGEVTINNQSVPKAIDLETGGYAFSYTVTNKQKVPLPATGGSGTMMFVTIGVLALTATGLYFLKRKDQEVA